MFQHCTLRRLQVPAYSLVSAGVHVVAAGNLRLCCHVMPHKVYTVHIRKLRGRRPGQRSPPQLQYYCLSGLCSIALCHSGHTTCSPICLLGHTHTSIQDQHNNMMLSNIYSVQAKWDMKWWKVFFLDKLQWVRNLFCLAGYGSYQVKLSTKRTFHVQRSNWEISTLKIG